MPTSDNSPLVSRRGLLRGAGALGLGVAGAGVLGGLFAGPAAADVVADPAVLQQRWRDLLTGGPHLDTANPAIAAAIGRVDRNAKSYLDDLITDPARTALWPDLADPTRSNHVTSSFNRIERIATAWATPGSRYAGDQAVGAHLVDALDWMSANRFSPQLPRYDNDWDWEIGSGLSLTNAVVLLRDLLGADRAAQLTAAVHHYTPDPNLWRVNRQIATGANRVWVCTVVAVRAGLDGATTPPRRGGAPPTDVEGDGANSVLAYNDEPGNAGAGTGEGFYRDGSFLQHYKHPYNGGYGKELLTNLSKLLYLLGGTQWQVTDPDVANVYGWIDDGFDPLMHRGDVMGSVSGREMARASKQDHAPAQTVIEATLRLIPAAPPETATRLTALAKQWITEDTYRDFLAVTAVSSVVAAQAVLASPVTPRGPLVRHHQYPRMDKVAHHRPGFALGVSAHSSRIYNYESIQNENLRGWHLSDGMVLLFTDDLGHYSGDYWPTVDPYRLPGTTVETRRLADSYGQRNVSTADWVGGTALPGTTFGAYGMDLRGYGGPLRAHKSWFFVDDVMVCVGSGISAPGAGTVETIVENRKLTSPDVPLLINGAPAPREPGWSATLDQVRWTHLEGTGGYVFPDRPTLRALREVRSATWRDINIKYGTDTVVSNPFVTLWHDHGTAPADAGYHYVQLPMATATQTARWCDEPTVRLLARSETVHAVHAPPAGLYAANFWAAGRVADLASDGPASVLWRRDRGTTTLALSDPTQTRATVTLDLYRPGLAVVSADPGVTVEATGNGVRVTADTADRYGATAHVVLRQR